MGSTISNVGEAPSRISGCVHDTGLSLGNQIVAGAVPVWTRMAEAGDRTIDEPTLDFGHRLIAKPQFLQDAGTKVFNKDIGSLDQFPQHTPAFSRLEIEAQAFLVSIDG